MTVEIFENIKQSLLKKYEAEAEAARANIEVYKHHMVGVGEHSSMTETIEKEYIKLDSTLSMIETLSD